MRWSGALVAAAVLVAATGCSGDDDAGAGVTTEAESTTTTTAPEATAPPTTPAPSTTPPTTVADTTTSTTTSDTSPTTTTTTTTVTPDRTTVVIAIVDAVDASWQASLDAVRDPFSDEKLALLDEHFTGVLLEGWRNTVSDYRERNYREIENPDEPDAFEVELASVAVNEFGTFAVVQGCSITSGVIVEVGGNSDGSDRVIEDGIGRTVVELELVKEDGQWKVEDARSPDETETIASCN